MPIQVKNKNGTVTPCKCGTWLKHWENYGGRRADKCSNIHCNRKAEVGGHIYKSNSEDKSVYIIPICKICNAISSEANYFVETKLVPASRQNTCGY